MEWGIEKGDWSIVGWKAGEVKLTDFDIMETVCMDMDIRST